MRLRTLLKYFYPILIIFYIHPFHQLQTKQLKVGETGNGQEQNKCKKEMARNNNGKGQWPETKMEKGNGLKQQEHRKRGKIRP